MTRSYTMQGVMGAAERAVDLAKLYLSFEKPKGLIHDVQGDPRFQQLGIDLLWELPREPVCGIEVKGDRQAFRGHYFFELISNMERNTPGCFLYTASNAILYVFLRPREVHRLPMPATREWFLQRSERFALRHTKTQVGRVQYTTVGALVPVRTVLAEVPGAIRYRTTQSSASKPLSHRTR